MRIVSLGPVLPYEGIPHAGGEYLRRHLTALARQHDLTLVVPDGAPLPEGVAVDPPVTVVRVRAAAWHHTPVGALLSPAAKVTRPVSPGLAWSRGLVRQDEVARALDAADLVELQWPEYAGLVPAVAAAAPRARVVVVEHDVLSQREQRHLRSSAGRKAQVRALLTLATVRRQERRLLGAADLVLTFSAKDRDLLAGSGVAARIEVIDPPLDEPDMPLVPSVRWDGHRVLFPAAFDRLVNHEAAMWLVERVWPQVLARCPDAELVLGGHGPWPQLADAARRSPGVHVTGYVTALGTLYRDADVVVAPLLSGAGVKFKVATAMLWGVPVVATSVGAEGLPVRPGEELLAVDDDARDFADAVCAALTDPARRRKVAENAMVFAHERFGSERFEWRLLALYDEVVRERR